METTKPFIIAVDGRSGSGKTTFATALAAALSRHQDTGLLHLEEVYPGWQGLAAALQTYRRLAQDLAAGKNAAWQGWDWQHQQPGALFELPAQPVIVIEGVGALDSEARQHVDLAIWLEAGAETRKRRALERDGETFAPYWDDWARQEEQYLAGHQPRQHAQVLLQAGDGEAWQQFEQLQDYLPQPVRALLGAAGPAATLPLLFEGPAPKDAAALFETLADGAAYAALLESTSHQQEDPLGRNRYSLLAVDTTGTAPRLLSHSGQALLLHGASVLALGAGFFDSLAGLWPGTQPEAGSSYPLPQWIGYLGYELKREAGAADLAAVLPDGTERPDAQFFAPDLVVVIDHELAKAMVHGAGSVDAEAVLAQLSASPQRAAAALPQLEFHSADTAAGYKDKIRAAQHQIYQGNTYEVCLTTQLSARAESYQPFEAYCRMRESSPAPFAHYLRLGRLEAASLSPERFVSISSTGALRAEPIKGTRPRGATVQADQALHHDLSTHPKDRAENIMIVDLLRNDLSHHAVPGSVKVARLCSVESYATVHQMVSTIDAQLAERSDSAAALKEAFPPGSMTGAPKLWTMNILDELEEHRARGLYSGAVGYLGFDGSADFSVVIRTLVCDRLQDGSWQLSLGLGGAITADSVPDEEWDEVITKSRGVLGALGASFPEA